MWSDPSAAALHALQLGELQDSNWQKPFIWSHSTKTKDANGASQSEGKIKLVPVSLDLFAFLHIRMTLTVRTLSLQV